MKRIILLLFIASITFSSCKKDEPNPDPEPEPTESVLAYYPLTVGNFWIYERSFCDSTWEDCTLKSIDTSFVTKDTVINNNTYFKVEGVNPVGQKSTGFLRDSLDYIVSSSGNIVFSNKDFTTKLSEQYIITGNNDTAFYIYTKMHEEPYSIQVPAGDFDCLDRRLSLFSKSDNFESERNTHNLFAKGIGPVYNQVMYVNSGAGFKQELIEFAFVICCEEN